MTSVFSWQNSISLCPDSFCTPGCYSKYDCYSKYFLTSYYCITVPYNEKDIFWGVLVLEGLVGLHRTIQLLDFNITCGIDLGYCDTEWFALETNSDDCRF